MRGGTQVGALGEIGFESKLGLIRLVEYPFPMYISPVTLIEEISRNKVVVLESAAV